MISPVSLERERIRRGGLYAFMRAAWHLVEPSTPYLDNWHIRKICRELQAVTFGETRNLAVHIPPGCMKSLIVEVFWPAWTWSLDHAEGDAVTAGPGVRFISASFDADLTRRDAKRSLELMQSPWYRERWPHVNVPRDAAAGSYENPSGGWRFATSIKGKVTGRHGHVFIVDDPIKPKEATKAGIEQAKEWWTGTRPTRFAVPEKSVTVLIMQRLHAEDPGGLAEEENKKAEREGRTLPWKIVRFPMEFEPAYACPEDERTEEGEPLWPERFSPDTIESLKAELGRRNAAAQLQQRPVPDGGLIFQRTWFGVWVPPAVSLPVLEGVRTIALPDKFDIVCQSWDCTFKDASTSDYVCGRVVARKGASFFTLEQVKRRMGFHETLAEIRAMTRKWPKAVAKLVEDKANGSAIIETLQKEIPGIIAVNPEGGKEARANAVSPLYEAGNVYDPHPALQNWVEESWDSFVAFPTAAHDDDVDAATQALLWLYKKRSNTAEAMRVIGEQLRRGINVLGV